MIDNQQGCFGGREAGLIVRGDDTACIGPETERTVEAVAGTDQS
jgi:hypothetical protein